MTRRTRRQDKRPPVLLRPPPTPAAYPEPEPEPPVYDDVWARNSDR